MIYKFENSFGIHKNLLLLYEVSSILRSPNFSLQSGSTQKKRLDLKVTSTYRERATQPVAAYGVHVAVARVLLYYIVLMGLVIAAQYTATFLRSFVLPEFIL